MPVDARGPTAGPVIANGARRESETRMALRANDLPSEFDPADEAIVMAALAAGSVEAMGVVYDRLAPPLRALAQRLAGPDEMEDIVQNTFERVWRHAARFDPARGSLDAWVLTIARNVALGQLRRRRPEELVHEPVDRSAGPAEAAERREVNLVVRRAVAALAPERRQVLEEVLAGRTLVQGAERLGLPEGTMKSRVRAAYAELRAPLAGLLSRS